MGDKPKNKIILPWPPAKLSPNARGHWGGKEISRKKYKTDCRMLAGKRSFPDGKIALEITFCPPDARRRDLDNMLASIKAGLDGVAAAWGVDDNRFRMTIEIGEPVRHGAVEIVLADTPQSAVGQVVRILKEEGVAT